MFVITPIIGSDTYGEKLFKIYLGTGTAWLEEFYVYAYSANKAVDLLADYLEESDYDGLWADYYALADECEVGQTVDEYAEAHNLTCCGSHGIYLEIVRIEEREENL